MLTGPINTIQKNYEALSDIVIEASGSVHGSQSHIVANNMQLIVYYEVPIEQRELIKQKFSNYTKNNQMILTKKLNSFLYYLKILLFLFRFSKYFQNIDNT